MYMKISCEKEIHLLNKKVNIHDLQAFIKTTFKNLPRDYSITYLDCDGDLISLVSEEDLKSLYETSKDKFVKVFINPLEESLPSILDSKIETVTEVQAPQKIEEVAEKVEAQEETQPEIITETIKTEKVEGKPVEQEIREQKRPSGCPFFQKFGRQSPPNFGPRFHGPSPFVQSPGGFNRSHGSFGPGPQNGPFPHSPFGGFPGFELLKAKFDDAITKKVDELMPCIINKVKNAIQEQVPEADLTNSQVVHSLFTCDGCGVFPIVGVRYNCSRCFNFDFCEKCEATVEHPHDFIKIKKPKNAQEGCHRWKRHHGWKGLGHHGGHHEFKGFWKNPEHKEMRRCWKLSAIFGGEPSQYQEFVASTLDLSCEEVIVKYSTDKNIQPKELSEEKIQRRCLKLSYMLKKPAESFRNLVKSNPYTKCWKLAKKVGELDIPESLSVVVETEPSVSTKPEVEKVEEIKEAPKIEQKVEKVECKPVEEVKTVQVKETKEAPKRKKELKMIEEVLTVVKEVIGDNEALNQFVAKNWKLGADKIVELWFEQH